MTATGQSFRKACPVPLAGVMLVLGAGQTHAHGLVGNGDGVLSGLQHPISGLDHVLAMVAVGIWAAQLGRPAVWLVPVTFPLAMAFGGSLGLVGVALPGVEPGIALSALLLGWAIACQARPSFWLAAVIVIPFALLHGHAHGSELPLGQNGLSYSVGFVIAMGGLHAVGLTLGLLNRLPVGESIPAGQRGRDRRRGAGVAGVGVLKRRLTAPRALPFSVVVPADSLRRRHHPN